MKKTSYESYDSYEVIEREASGIRTPDNLIKSQRFEIPPTPVNKGFLVLSLSHFLDILNFIIFLDLCQYDDTIFSGRQIHPSNTHIRRP